MSISFRNIRDEGVRKVNSAAERLLIKSEGSIVLQLSDNTMWIYNNGTWAIIAGGLQYQGTWDASTNTPTLASGVGTQGQYYVVSVAGSTNLDGITSWATGDWAIFNGTTWQKIDNTNAYLPLTGGTLTGALNINGSADSVQLRIRGNATQTANLQEWLNSAGTVRASVSESGLSLPIVGYLLNYKDLNINPLVTTGYIRYNLGTGGTFSIGGSSFYGGATLDVRASSAATVGLNIRAAGSQTANLTQWQDSAANVLASMTASGKLGIGATSPAVKLEVSDSSGDEQLRIKYDATHYWKIKSASDGGLSFTPNSGTGFTWDTNGILYALGLANSSTGSNASVRTLAAGTVITRNIADSNPALIVNQASSGAASTGDLLRLQYNSTSKVVVNYNGNVGIGTTSPQVRLHIVGSAFRGESDSTDATAKSFDIIQGHHTNAQAPFSLFTTISNATQSIVWIGGGSGSYNSATDVRIFTGASNTTLTGTERLRVTSTGNVGIGTTNPQGRLDVSAGGATQTAGDLVVDSANNLVYVGRLDSVSGNTNFIFRDRLGQVKSRWENAGSGSIGFSNFSDGFGIRISRSPTALASAIGNIGALFFVNASDAPTSFPTVILRAHGAQTTDQLQFQNSAGTTLSSIGSDGRLNIRSDYASGAVTLIDFAGNRATLKIDASANFEWNTSSGRNTDIRSGGVTTAFFGNNLNGNNVTIGATTNLAKLAVVNTVASTVATIIRGAVSQSANLTEWQNSSATILAKVDASGNIVAPSVGINASNYMDVNSGLRLRSNPSGIEFWPHGTDTARLTTGGFIVGGNSINASAILQADSTTKGFLPPRMTSTQKTTISTPATGLVVYDTTLNKLCVYTGSAWETVTSV